MGKYQTEQKKLLIAFMEAHKNEQFSAEELSKILAGSPGKDGKAPGKSTVYRLVSELAEEGVLRRFPRQAGRGWLYQFHQRNGCSGILHLKCRECGLLQHLDSQTSSMLLKQIRRDLGFTVDNDASVLYGLCASCEKTSLPVYTERKEHAPCPRHRKKQNPFEKSEKKEKTL